MASSSRRNMQHRTASSYAEDASRLIRENMKCPVCLEVLLPPIYQCETGHNICYLCVDEVTECPLCKSDYGDTRNYFAEELVNSMTFACKYEEYGCHKTFLGSQLKDHQQNCECQPYRCPELACQEVVGINQMAKHLDKHGFKVMTGDVHQASIEILDDHFERKTEYNPWRISAFGVEFYTVSTRSREGQWYFWAYGLGVQKELKKYSYEIVLYSEEKQIMYRGVIQSLRHSPEDIMKNGNCLITTDHVIKSIRKGGRIKCQVYFIQGKNWDAARATPACDSTNKRNAKDKIKKTKKSNGTPKEKANNGSGGGGSKKNFPSTATFTSPLLSNQNSSITSQLSAPQKSRSRGLGIAGSVRTSPMDLFKRELDVSNGNRIISKMGSSKTGKNGKLANIVTRPATSGVADDENAFVQRVRETLRCPTCNEVIIPPVYQCLIGHNVCHKCRMSRQDCSLCLSPLTDCRNFFAEELLYRTFQRCLYFKHGCKVCLPTAQMKSHEAVCDYAPFECPFNVCRALLRSDDLLEHMKTHQVSTVEKELKSEVFIPRNPPTSAVSIIPNILTVDKTEFYPIIVRESDGNWLFYVITHNYPKYRFELLLRKQHKTLAFQGPVLSLRSNISQVKLNGSALVVTEKAVKSLKVYDKLTFQIKIRKLESPTEGALGKESTLNLPSSWILGPRSGEIVSKTELFANKKTSVSPDEDSDEEDEAPPSLQGRNDEQRESNSETDNAESEVDDSNSEAHTVSGTSLATTQDDIESEYEARISTVRSRKSRESIARKSNEQLSIQLRSPHPSTSSLSSRKAKRVTLQDEVEISEDEPPPMEQQLLKRSAASSTVISIDHTNQALGLALPILDRNNNLDNAGGGSGSSRRRLSMSTESLALAGTFPPVDTCNRECDNRNRSPIRNVPISILKPTENPLAGNSSSMHSLKMARGTYEVASQSSSLLSDPLILPERILKKALKRSRSASKHRVRLSDQVICCGASDPLEDDINGNTSCCKSQTNLRVSSNSKTSIRTVPSKHVLSVQIRENEDKKPAEKSKSNEFQQLKQAISDHNTSAAFMEEVDLLTVKSLNEMTEAVICGSFDVVKSVISLFTSDSPDAKPNGEGEPPLKKSDT